MCGHAGAGHTPIPAASHTQQHPPPLLSPLPQPPLSHPTPPPSFALPPPPGIIGALDPYTHKINTASLSGEGKLELEGVRPMRNNTTAAANIAASIISGEEWGSGSATTACQLLRIVNGQVLGSPYFEARSGLALPWKQRGNRAATKPMALVSKCWC